METFDFTLDQIINMADKNCATSLLPEGFKPTDSDDESECDSLHIESAQEIAFPFSSHLPDFLTSLDVDTVTVELGPEDCEVLTEDGTIGNDLPPVTPTKPQDGCSLDPVTPTANLKLLMSAVSPEIRNMEKRQKSKALFNAIVQAASEENMEMQQDADCEVDVEVDVEGGSQVEDCVEDEDKSSSRKSKSLGLLCQRFLSRYPDYPIRGIAMEISLDAVSRELSVERRRIYDIVNVLESIEMVQRRAKNKYLWHGKTNLVATLVRLKCLGERNQYANQMEHLKRVQVDREYQQEMSNGGKSKKQPLRDFTNTSGQQDGQQFLGKRFLEDDPNARKDKSLGVMSQKFIMLFLVSKNQVVTLDIAARVLIGDINYEVIENAKFKTKVRRLYDIANILTSLKMIKKVHIHERRGRKPAFRWIGPNPDISDIDINNCNLQSKPVFRHSTLPASTAVGTSYHPQIGQPKTKSKRVASFTRHSSFNIIKKAPESEERHCSSAPNSPVKVEGKMPAISPLTNEKFQREFDTLRTKYPECMSKLFAACNIEKERMQRQEIDQQLTTSDEDKFNLPITEDAALEVSDQLQTARKVLDLDTEDERIQTGVSQEALNTLLTETVDSLHVALRDAEKMRRSKRTIKQPVKDEFEYQPVVKRSKIEVQAAAALQKCNDQNGQKMHITLQRVKSQNLTEQVMSELTTKQQTVSDFELTQDPAVLQTPVEITQPAVSVEVRRGSAFVPLQHTSSEPSSPTMANNNATSNQLPTTVQLHAPKPNLPLIRNPTKTMHIPKNFVKKLLCNETLDTTSKGSSKDSFKRVTIDGKTIYISTKPINSAATLPKSKTQQSSNDHSTEQVSLKPKALVPVEMKKYDISTEVIQKDLTIVSIEPPNSGKISAPPPESPPFHPIAQEESTESSSETDSCSETASPKSSPLQLSQDSSRNIRCSSPESTSKGTSGTSTSKVNTGTSEVNTGANSQSQSLSPCPSEPKSEVVVKDIDQQCYSAKVSAAPVVNPTLHTPVVVPNHMITTIPNSCIQTSLITAGIRAAPPSIQPTQTVRLGVPLPVTRVTLEQPRVAFIPSVSTHSTVGQFMPISSVLPPHPAGPMPMSSPLYNPMQASTAIPTTNHIPLPAPHAPPQPYTSTPAGLITPTSAESQQITNNINFYRTPTNLPLGNVQPKAFLNGQAVGVPTPYVLSGIGGSIGQLQPVSRRLTLSMPPFSQT